MGKQNITEADQQRQLDKTASPKRKVGRPYKNPHLVPQGLADYIREIKAQRDDLLTAIRPLVTWMEWEIDDTNTNDLAKARTAIARAEARP